MNRAERRRQYRSGGNGGTGHVDQVSVGFLHPGTVSALFTTSLLQAVVLSGERILANPYGYLSTECSSGGIVDGRNKICDAVLQSESDWLFMVDSDMAFAPDTIERLIEAADPDERPVVGALCFAHKRAGRVDLNGTRFMAQPTVYDFYEDDERVGFVPRYDYERDALLNVAGTGAACTLIHRSAIEAVADKFQGKPGHKWYDPITHPKGTTFSEDLSFCVRVAACGIPLYVHTGIRTGHDKGGVFLDEDYYDRQQASIAAGIQTLQLADSPAA